MSEKNVKFFGPNDKDISVRVHTKGTEIILAACDKELLGKKLISGKLRLFVNKDFYDGEKVSDRVFLARLKIATIANLVGKKCVRTAIRAGFIDEDSVLYIDGVPHAQLFVL